MLKFAITYITPSNCFTIIFQNVPGSDGKVEKLKGSDKILPSLIGVVSVFLVCQVRPPAKLITLALCL